MDRFGDPVFVVRVVNSGRHSIKVQCVYASVRSGKRFPVDEDVLILLEEAKSFEFDVPQSGFSKAAKSPDYITAFEAEDVNEKKYVFKTRSKYKWTNR